jgi:hypothetical protein
MPSGWITGRMRHSRRRRITRGLSCRVGISRPSATLESRQYQIEKMAFEDVCGLITSMVEQTCRIPKQHLRFETPTAPRGSSDMAGHTCSQCRRRLYLIFIAPRRLPRILTTPMPLQARQPVHPPASAPRAGARKTARCDWQFGCIRPAWVVV